MNIYNGPTTNIAGVFKVGRPYNLDAFVGKGTNYIFSDWLTTPVDVGTTTNNWVQKSKLPFLMQEGMTITAMFKTNPFSAWAGTYNGLFHDTNNGVSHESAGFVQIKLKEKSTYSGYLFVDGAKRPFSGKMLTDGTVTKEVSRSKLPAQPSAFVSLVVDGGTKTITGTVTTNGEWTSQILADKMIYTESNPETNNAGNYTLQIPTAAGAPFSTPGGVGYGAVTNSPLGLVKLGGLLGDNEKIVQKVAMSQNGQWPLYVPLYKNALKEYKGTLIGWVTFDGSSNAPIGQVTWIKKDGSDSSVFYGGGFTNAGVELATSPYVAPPLGTLPIAINVGDRVLVSDGNLSAPVTNVVTAVVGAKVTLSKTTTEGFENKATITFKSKDGTFSGGFNNPVTKTKTQGAVLQNTTNASGFFMGTSESGTVILERD